MSARMIYLLKSAIQGKYISQLICIWCAAFLSFILLLDITCIASYYDTKQIYKDVGLNSVVWYERDMFFWGIDKCFTLEYKQELMEKEESLLNSEEMYGASVQFDVVRFDDSDSVLVFNNEYFNRFYGLDFDLNPDSDLPRIILNDSYRGEYHIGDIFNIDILEFRVIGFKNTYMYSGSNPIKIDGVIDKMNFDNTNDITFYCYKDNYAIIPKNSYTANDLYNEIRKDLITVNTAWTSQEKENEFDKQAFGAICYTVLLLILSITITYLVFYSRIAICIIRRRRIMALQCICGATWKECVLSSFLWEFLITVIGFALGGYAYIMQTKNWDCYSFFLPLKMDFRISNLIKAFIVELLTIMIILIPNYYMESKNSIIDMMHREDI